MVVEETHCSGNSISNGMEFEDQKVGGTEDFYEMIEAPKFVDFNVPDHYRPDDRYWFCLRVGCDQKHEEEMDSEAISKNFVLRVMAARSPNVRLHKALKRNCSSKNMKCPLSAPPKSSKSRLSRLAIISSISQKMDLDDNKVKVKALPKVCSTPKAKGKQVAAKYLTTPWNKKCIANPHGFRSVQNAKPPSIAVPKNRLVPKTLIFQQSPKKAFSLKKNTSVELRTPLTKLCEKMRRLEVTSQRKPALSHSSKLSKQLGNHPQKSMPLHSSARQKDPNKEKCGIKKMISQRLHSRQSNQNAKALRFSKGKSKRKLSKHSSIKEVVSCSNATKAKSGDEMSGDYKHSSIDPVKEEEAASCPIISNAPSLDASNDELNSSSNSAQTNTARDDIPNLQASINEDDGIQGKVQESKVCFASQQNSNNVSTEYEISLAAECESETAHNDDKENASNFDENRSFNHKSDQSGRKILGIQNSDRRKVTETVDKDLKGQATNGAPGVKSMKLKPTNPKPFKLRTDERGILREANLVERKNHAITPKKEAALLSRFQGRDLQGQHVDTQKGIAAQKPKKQQIRTRTPTGLRFHHPKQQELKPPTTPTCESNTRQELDHVTKSSTGHVFHSQRHLSVTTEAMTPDKPLSVIVKTSSGKSKPKEIGKQRKKVDDRVPGSSSGALPQRRRLVTTTIPNEPNFHSSRMPKSCAGKIS